MNQLHELQAERNARKLLLAASQEAALAHLECVVGAILAKLDTTTRANVLGEINKTEGISPAERSTVRLSGESDTPSKRETWRRELADLDTKIAELTSDNKEVPR